MRMAAELGVALLGQAGDSLDVMTKLLVEGRQGHNMRTQHRIADLYISKCYIMFPLTYLLTVQWLMNLMVFIIHG